MKLRFGTYKGRTAFITSATITATAAFFLLVILSPLALREFGNSTRTNWSQLSSIGQTYGAISALLTAMALIGVVASLLFQARDVRLSKEQAIRAFQHELIRMELDDPLYMNALGAPWDMPIPPEQDRIREFLYIHMWVSFWQTFYVMGMMPEDQLRRACERELFYGEPGRRYWEYSRETRPLYTKDRRVGEFHRILEEEYRRAVASRPKVTQTVRTNQSPDAAPKGDMTRAAKIVGNLLMAAATGALVDRIVNRRI